MELFKISNENINNEEIIENRSIVKAVCLLNVRKGSLNEVIGVLKSLSQVTKITSVTGDADIIAHIEVTNPDDFHDIYADVIDKIPGVKQTKTYVVMREFKLR